MHGSGRVSLRNRKFLRKIQPYLPAVTPVPVPTPVPTSVSTPMPTSVSTPVPTPVLTQDAFAPHREVSEPAPHNGSIAPSQEQHGNNWSGDIRETPQPVLTASTPVSGQNTDSAPSPSSEPAATKPVSDSTTSTSSSPTIQPRSTRDRRAPPWHTDYVMS